MRGTIEVVARTGKSFKLEGDSRWFSVFSPSDLQAQRGDYVEFEFTQKGNFNNAKVVKASSGGGQQPQQQSGSGNAAPKPAPQGRTFPVGLLAPERTINRQNALTNAVTFVKDNAEATVDDVLEIARKFEAYTTGDLDLEEAKHALDSMGG